MKGKEKRGMTACLFSHPLALYAEGSQVPGENGHTAAVGVVGRMPCDEEPATPEWLVSLL